VRTAGGPRGDREPVSLTAYWTLRPATRTRRREAGRGGRVRRAAHGRPARARLPSCSPTREADRVAPRPPPHHRRAARGGARARPRLRVFRDRLRLRARARSACTAGAGWRSTSRGSRVQGDAPAPSSSARTSSFASRSGSAPSARGEARPYASEERVVVVLEGIWSTSATTSGASCSRRWRAVPAPRGAVATCSTAGYVALYSRRLARQVRELGADFARFEPSGSALPRAGLTAGRPRLDLAARDRVGAKGAHLLGGAHPAVPAGRLLRVGVRARRHRRADAMNTVEKGHVPPGHVRCQAPS
jgi:hypothetical protein